MDLNKIKELMALVEASKLKKLVVKEGAFELHLEKEGEAPVAVHAPLPPRPALQHSHADAPPSKTEKEHGRKAAETEGRFVTSPMVGTFYTAPAPDQPSFVKIGDRVQENTVICLVEAMKVMNEVKAGVSGTVAEVLVDNAQPVEFGSRMFRIV